ncbi:MAG: hypothetical protein ACI9YL_000076 [Luteibaculaceae bacterium]
MNIIHRISSFFKTRKNQSIRKKFLDRFDSFEKVQFGPFKGLVYPTGISIGSSSLPKLLGSYECELHSFFESIRTNNYSLIADVGCAEGFYLVALKKWFPSAKVIGFDIDPLAPELCVKLGEANGLQEEIAVSENFDWSYLQSVPGRKLLIMDVEGAEMAFLKQAKLTDFNHCDILVEVHDWMMEGDFGKLLAETLEGTHSLSTTWSWDKERKKFNFQNFLSTFDPVIQDLWVEEGRKMSMYWIIARYIDK